MGYDSCVNNVNIPSYINDLSYNAYGAPLVQSDGGSHCSVWCKRWSIIIQHGGLHYSLPSGSVGRHYVEQLNEEMNFL